MMRTRKSPWRSEVFVPPSDRVEEPSIVFFGCQPWEPRRDLSMGRQDEATGLWSPGRERRHDRCGTCGETIAPGSYCEGCAGVDPRSEMKLESQYVRDIYREQERLRKEEEERNSKTFAERMHGHAGSGEDAA